MTLDDIKPDTPVRLEIAARLAFPDGSITTKSLRLEARRGRLRISRIAGKDMTTLREIQRMVELCHVEPLDPASGSSPRASTEKAARPSNNRSGVSATLADTSGAQAALLTTVKKLRSTLPSTSYRSTQPPRVRNRDPAEIKIADVLSIYATDRVTTQVRPKEVLSRIERLAEFFGERVLAEINGGLCRDYAAWRGKPVARRELEDMRAAITHHWREGYCATLTAVVLPEKGRPRERWLTRSEAARLLWTAWRMTQSWKGQESDRRTGRHVARFILVGLYTGSRAGAICNASFERSDDSGFIDLERGVFYRRAPHARVTKKRQPPCPIPDRLLAHLKRWRERGISIRNVIEWNGESVGRVSKGFRRACATAGLGNDVTPHTLRHTAATWIMQNGVPSWQAAGFLGMTEETIRDVYGHHHPDHLEAARKGIQARHKPDRNAGIKGGQTGVENIYVLEKKRSG